MARARPESADRRCDHRGEGPASVERQVDAVPDEVLRTVRGRPIPVREDDVGPRVRRVLKEGVDRVLPAARHPDGHQYDPLAVGELVERTVEGAAGEQAVVPDVQDDDGAEPSVAPQYL